MAPVHIFEISLVKYFGKTALERMSSCPLCPADNSFFSSTAVVGAEASTGLLLLSYLWLQPRQVELAHTQY